jgi:hypothetical protein
MLMDASALRMCTANLTGGGQCGVVDVQRLVSGLLTPCSEKAAKTGP